MALLSISFYAVASSSSTYYSKLTANVSPSGAGTVYVSNDTSKKGSSNSATNNSSSTDSSVSHTYRLDATSTANSGYKWKGWYENSAGTGTALSTSQTNYQYSVSASSTSSSSPTSKTVYGVWVGVNYTIIFVADDATSGEMDDLDMVYGTAKNLTANAYHRAYTVTFDANGGECGTTSATAEYAFANWKNGDKTYADKANVDKLTTTDDDKITFIAQWTPKAVTLPTPTRAYYKFLGWFDGENKIGDAGAEFTPTADIALTAQWQPVATVTVAPAAIAELVYNGEDQTLISAGEAVNGTILYSLDGTNYSTDLPQGKDAKAYTVYFKVEPVEGGIGVEPANFEVTIAKANPTVTTEPAAVAELVFNGEDQALISAGEAENGTFQYSLDNAAFAAELPTGKDAKTYDVYYKVVGNDNYNDIEFATPIEAAIAKADVTLTAPVAYDTLAYNGADQELITAGEVAGGTLLYSADGENFSDVIPTAQEIGDYTVYYRVDADNNHNSVEKTAIEVSIVKPRAELTLAPSIVEELVYDGVAHTLITAGEAAGGELQYSLDGENYATTLPEGTNAQTYTVYYKVVGDENHSDLVGTPLEVTIAKVALTIAAENKETTYGVEAPAFTVTYQGFIGEETEAVLDGELAFDCEYAVGSNAGEYVITPKGLTAQNYNITFNNGKLTVAKAALSVTAEDKETTYGAEAPAFTVAYEGFYGEETEAVLTGELAFACEYAVGSNVGEYTITPSGLEAVNYEITFNEGKLTVAKAALSVTAENKQTTYGAEAPAFTVAYEGFIGEETEAVLEGEIAFACEYEVGNNAGEYTITPSGLTAGNYEITFNEGKLTVAKAALSVTADNKETTYGAETPAFTVAYEGFIGEETEAVLTGELAFACEYTVGNNAGEYTITPSGLTADNYDITFNNGTLTVAKVDVEIVVAPAAKAGLVYTGEPQELITAGEVTGGELQYSLKANKDFSTDIPTRTEIGFYQVYFRVVADANHNDVAATMIMTRIAGAKASLTVEPVAAENLVYTGEAQALLATAGEAEGGELQYSLDGENYTAAEPVATNAGDYTVYYKVVGDGTHSDLEPATLNVSIAKADAAVAAAPEAIENLVANGEDHELVTAGEAIGGTIVYSLDGENFSAELPVASEEGDYTVTYKVQGDENHNDSEAAELTVTIAEQGTATAVDNSRSQVTVKKVIRDNQVLIIREGRTYNASGLLVK